MLNKIMPARERILAMKKTDQEIKQAARDLSALGASKGGKARAARLTPQQRQDIARGAAEKRWEANRQADGQLPMATHVGILDLAGLQIPCAVLGDGRRVLSQRGVYRTFGSDVAPGGRGRGRTIEGEGKLPRFFSSDRLIPFIPDELSMRLIAPIVYVGRGPRGGSSIAHGIEARLIPDICEVWLKARDAGVLHHTQAHIAAMADVLMRALAHTGIIALVDEATGYQQDRARDELQKILAAYIAEELRPWVKVFPHSFFEQAFRLYGWEYREGGTKRPPVLGHFINRTIYERLPRPVLPELRRLNPVVDGRRRHKHHQYLTETIGIPHLDTQVQTVTTLMRASISLPEFWKLLRRVCPVAGDQTDLSLPDEAEE
jgi:hypothetical protein